MLNEDTVPGTAIVTYVATDDDHGDDGRVHYEIVSITTGIINILVLVVPWSGKMTTEMIVNTVLPLSVTSLHLV